MPAIAEMHAIDTTDNAPQSDPAARSTPRIEARAVLRLAMPIMLIALVNMGMSITDTIMVSAYFGADALAAVAVGSDLYSIVFYLAAGIIGGISPFYTAAIASSHANERKRLDRVGWVLVALLALVGAPLIWFAPDWLSRFGLDAGVVERGTGYTQSMAVLLIPMLGIALCRTLLTAVERPKVFLKVTLAMLPLNAIANLVFMNGLGPVPALGPTGAGVSSVLVAITSLTVLVVVARSGLPSAYVAAGVRALDRQRLTEVLRVGFPIGITMLAETGIFLGCTLYAATLGAAQVAAHALSLRVAGLAYAGSAALLQAAMVRTAKSVALRQDGAARSVSVASLWLAVVGGVAWLLFLVVAGPPLANALLGTDATGLSAAEIAAGLLLWLGVIQLAGYPSLTASGLLRGRKDSRTPMFCMLIGYWLIGAPLGIYLCEAHAMGVTGLWVGLAAGTCVTAVLTLLQLRRSKC